MRRGLTLFNTTSIALGLAFLYLPIAILMIYSFNASRLVAVWGGWSTRWYAALLEDRAMIDAALASLGIATVSAGLATVLGTMAAVALTRFRFRGHLSFAAMIYAPLVMPEVITGLSLLLLFVAIDLDRGFLTIIIAHTTLTMCFVTVIVQSRLIGFDRSLEEAAMDLGATPAVTFRKVTLPLIAPGILSAALIAFALSVDDFVITYFNAGSETTFPLFVWGAARVAVPPQINVIGSMIFLVAIVLMFANIVIQRRRGDAPLEVAIPTPAPAPAPAVSTS